MNLGMFVCICFCPNGLFLLSYVINVGCMTFTAAEGTTETHNNNNNNYKNNSSQQ